MVWLVFLSALGLMFVFEGILPFLSPRFYRVFIHRVIIQNDKTVRVMGLISMLVGLGFVCIAHYLF